MKVAKGLVLDKKSTLGMYRDCLKSVSLMNPNKVAQKNIALHYRMEFEK